MSHRWQTNVTTSGIRKPRPTVPFRVSPALSFVRTHTTALLVAEFLVRDGRSRVLPTTLRLSTVTTGRREERRRPDYPAWDVALGGRPLVLPCRDVDVCSDGRERLRLWVLDWVHSTGVTVRSVATQGQKGVRRGERKD